MGWFDEQIKERRQYDDDAFSEAFANMASAVMGKRFEAAFTNDRAVTKDAIDEILKYYHVKSREVPDSIKDVNEQLEFLMRPYGIMRRTVKLEDGWYRDAVGAMLGTLSESGRVVALIPSGLSGYSFFDYETGKARRITRKNQHLFDDEAIAFYKPFPLKKLSIASLSAYIVQTLSVSDFVLIALATLAVSLVGLLSPMLSRLLFDRVLPSGNTRILLALAAFTVCVSVSTLLLSAVKSMLTARIETKLNLSVEAATMMRVMSLPADFFKQYSAGELSSRVEVAPSREGALLRARQLDLLYPCDQRVGNTAPPPGERHLLCADLHLRQGGDHRENDRDEQDRQRRCDERRRIGKDLRYVYKGEQRGQSGR